MHFVLASSSDSNERESEQSFYRVSLKQFAMMAGLNENCYSRDSKFSRIQTQHLTKEGQTGKEEQFIFPHASHEAQIC